MKREFLFMKIWHNKVKSALKYAKSRLSCILTLKKKISELDDLKKYKANYVVRFLTRLEAESGCVIVVSVRLCSCIR
jgi:hypothetical protein